MTKDNHTPTRLEYLLLRLKDVEDKMDDAVEHLKVAYHKCHSVARELERIANTINFLVDHED